MERVPQLELEGKSGAGLHQLTKETQTPNTDEKGFQCSTCCRPQHQDSSGYLGIVL